ncbi:MAG: 50S ribosomal protein L17 [Bacteriovoracaceae bacterium]|nr:50S ribosomal protein L17 [Bacteriovoracaceae bacterium]
MRHSKYKYKLNVTSSHRKALIKNLSIELIDHGKIKSTHAKCKALQPVVEKLITLAKEDSVANRRLAYSKLNNKDAVTKLFTEVAPKFKTRNGGYTRITKIADLRVGDAAKVSYISLV